MKYFVTLLLIISAFLFSGCTKEQGCTNPDACNFSQSAEEDDGSCYLPGYECDDGNSTTLNDSWNFLCSCEGECGLPVLHHGYEYSTVLIGGQCWFSENCRYLPDVSWNNQGSVIYPHYYVYDFNGTNVASAKATSNYETYGVLYNWPAVMTDSICPTGWHIPSDGEFTELTDFLGGVYAAGGKMKEAGYDHWNTPNAGATNSSGFSGLPGGRRHSGGGFDEFGNYGNFWSASESVVPNSWKRTLFYSTGEVFRTSTSRSSAYSARCVRD